jgi:hypothetical protein
MVLTMPGVGVTGNFGISGKLQLTQMGKLSDGQKSRLIFAIVSMCVRAHPSKIATTRRRISLHSSTRIVLLKCT